MYLRPIHFLLAEKCLSVADVIIMMPDAALANAASGGQEAVAMQVHD